MKFGKYLLCGTLLLGAGAMFVGCSDKPATQKPTPLKEFVIDGFTGFDVEYNGDYQLFYTYVANNSGGFKTQYSIDGQNYVSRKYLSSLDDPDTVTRELKDAGEYTVYIRLSQEGYKDYIARTTMKIRPRKIDLTLSNVKGFIGDAPTVEDVKEKVSHGYIDVSQLIEGEIPSYSIELGKLKGSSISNPVMYDATKATAGQTYEILGVDTDKNYEITFSNKGNFTLVDNLTIVRDGETKYYRTLSSAIAAAKDGETINLTRNIEVTETIKLNKSITIDGKNKYTIKATENFIGAKDFNDKLTTSIIHIDPENANVVLNLKDVTLDCSNSTRAVSVFSGKLELNNAKIINGECVDNRRSGGVYISHAGSFVMNSGEILGSVANETDYTKFCADLWIGANATGSLASINGGKIGNVFVNSNSHSATNPGTFTLNGGEIENVYVEYDAGYGATFNYVTGEIENIYIASIAQPGLAAKVSAKESTTYKGGVTSYNEVEVLQYAAINYVFDGTTNLEIEEGKSYLLEGCTFTVPLTINQNADVEIKNCVFDSSSLNTGDYTTLIVNKVKNLTIDNCVFGGNLTVGSKATPGCDILINATADIKGNITITNNDFKAVSSQNDVAIIVLASTGLIEGKVTISNNKFEDVANEIQIGLSAIDGSIAEEVASASANFDIEISKNLNDVEVREMFNEIPSGEKEFVTVEKGKTYTHSKTVEEE